MEHDGPAFPFDREAKDEKQMFKSEEDRAASTVRSFMDASIEYRRPFLENANQAYDLYRNHSQIRYSNTQRANLKLPKAHEVIQNIVPQLVSRFTSSRPYIRARGRGPEDEVYGELLTDFFDQQLDQMDFEVKFLSFCIEMLVAGTAFAKIPYKFVERLVKRTVTRTTMEFDPTTGESFPISFRDKEEKLETVFDGPDFEVVPFSDIFPDWSIKTPGDIQSMRGIVHRTFRSLEELKRNEERTAPDGQKVGIYKNLKKLEDNVLGYGSNAWHRLDDAEAKERYKQLDLDDREKELGKIEIWEYWGKFSKGANLPEEYIITIANGGTVIRMEPNPIDANFKPFLAVPNNPIPGEFYGDGDILPISSIIKEMTALRNARLDQVKMSLNKMFKVQRDAGVNLKSLVYQPHGIVLTNDINGIQPLEHGDIPQSSYRDSNQLDFELQSAAGIFNPSQQTGNIGRAFSRTATGVGFLQDVVGGRIELKSKMLDNMLFKRLGWFILQYARQFVTDDMLIRMSNPQTIAKVGNPFVTLPADAFFMNYDFIVNTIKDEELEYTKFQTFAQILQIAEQSQPGTVKFEAVLNEFSRFLVGNKLTNFVRSTEERMALLQQGLIQSGNQGSAAKPSSGGLQS